MALITINGISVDPIVQRSDSVNPAPPHTLESDYILIQTNPSLNKDRKVELANLGVTILEYVPRYTYICHYPGTDLTEIRALPYVAWVSVYLPGFKLGTASMTSVSTTEPSRVRNLTELSVKPQDSPGLAPKQVDIVFHANVDPNDIRKKIAAAAHLDPDDLKLGHHKVRITIPIRYLANVAGIDEVRHIEEVRPPELLNNVAREILGIGQFNGEISFEGEGQIVVVADSGFDSGRTDIVHPAFQGRVMRLYDLGRPGNANDPTGHGTHVAGSVLGDGTSATFGPVRGTAPKARLIVQALFGAQGELTGLPDDLHSLFLPPYQNDGARIHTNSWGKRPGQGEYDQLAREADDFVWNHRDFVICCAAGNEGSDHHGTGRIPAQSITSPGTAKNCITVGATETNRQEFSTTYGNMFSSDFPVNPIASDKMANNMEGVAAFSSRGPTKDQRIKPDVVAPGTFILSAQSRALVGANFGWRPGGGDFYFDGGTSMATPLVAGCVAVVREFLFKVHNISNPSASLVKALLINGAREIAGQYQPTECGPIPNLAAGFGRVDMPATMGSFAAPLKDEATALDDDQEETIKITVTPPTSMLKVTLVWTDPPGEHLQNDLDLIVRAANGEERHGNVNPTSSDFDRANNVEQVVWNSVPAGEVDIIVRAHRITKFPQSYALVMRTE